MFLSPWSLLHLPLSKAVSIQHLQGPQLGSSEDDLACILSYATGGQESHVAEVLLLWEQGQSCFQLWNSILATIELLCSGPSPTLKGFQTLVHPRNYL